MNQTTTDQTMIFWNCMRHHRAWIFLGTVFLSLLGFAVIFLLPDHYKASTTILVDPQQVPEHYVSPTVSSDPAQRLNTITDQVLSSTRLQQIIEELQLYPGLRGQMSREEIVDAMRKNIVVRVKQGPSADLSSFTIEYEGTHPQEVARVANQLAASFIEWNVRNRKQQAEDTTQFLEAQLKSAKQNLETQERNVSAFKMQHLGEMPEQQTANLQEVSQLQTQLQVNAEALNRLDMERTLLMRGVDPGGLGSAPKGSAPLTERGRLEDERLLLKRALLEMKRRYTAAYPAYRDATARLQAVEEEIKTLPPDPVVAEDTRDNSPATVRLQLLDREAKRLNAEQARITSQIAAYRGKIDAVPIREQEMAELDRNYSITKEHYQSLLDKTFSAGMAADLERKQQAEHFTILDAAQLPERPFKPRRMLLLPGAFLAALMLSIGLAWLKDNMDSSLKVERQLKAMLPAHVPLLTAIPNLPDTAARRRALRFAVVAVLMTLIGCALEAGLFLKLHPIL
jgi:polysaccharide chain length determinant protein (PEP-CTERM system associated)